MVPQDCIEAYETDKDFFGTTYYFAMLLGFILVLSLLVDLLVHFMPEHWRGDSKWFGTLVRSGGLFQEGAARKSASRRVTEMLKNALSMSYSCEKGTSRASTSRLAMERFFLSYQTTEECGGIVWTWKKIFNGSIFTQEGIWFSSRLLTVNFVQWMVLGMIIFFICVLYNTKQDYFYTEEELVTKSYVESFLSNMLSGNATGFQEDQYIGFLNCTQSLLGDQLMPMGLNGTLIPSGLNDTIDYSIPEAFVPYISTMFGNIQSSLSTTLSTCATEFPEVASFLSRICLQLSVK